MSVSSTSSRLRSIAEQVISDVYLDDGSLFTPTQQIWTLENLVRLRASLPGPHRAATSYTRDLFLALEAESVTMIQLAGELHYVYFLPQDIGEENKRTAIQDVLSALESHIEDYDSMVPDCLDRALAAGPGNRKFTPPHHANRPPQIRFLVAFCVALKELSREGRLRVLGDPSELDAFLRRVPHDDEDNEHINQERRAIRYLIDLGRSAIADLEPPSRWDEFVYWAKKISEHESFRPRERDYKLEYAQQVITARDKFRNDDEGWLTELRRAMTGGAHPVHYMVTDNFRKWCQSNPVRADEALNIIWNEERDPHECIHDFLEIVPRDVLKGPSARLSMASFLLSARDPTMYPVYRAMWVDKSMALLRYPSIEWEAPDADKYKYVLSFLDQLRSEFQERTGIEIDRLTAQGLAWATINWGYEDAIFREWSEEEREAFRRFREGDKAQAVTATKADPPRRTRR